MPVIKAPPERATKIAQTDFQPTFFFNIKTVTKSTTKGCSAANTAALAILVIFTALNQVKKWPNKKIPAMKHQAKSFGAMAFNFSLFMLLVKTGIAKKGSAIVSRQNPIAIEGAAVSLPNMPDVAPKTTAITVMIFAYFPKKLIC